MANQEQENQGVGKSLTQGFANGVQQDVTAKAKKKLRVPTAEEVSMGGRIVREATKGAGVGAQVGRKIPRVGAGLGAAGGAVVGAGRGVVSEADRIVKSRAEAGAAKAVPVDRGRANSQAGLQAVATGRSMSSPSPGAQGSRFNPVVRERQSPEESLNLTGFKTPSGQEIWMSDARLADKGAPEGSTPIIDKVPGMPERRGAKSEINVQDLIKDVPLSADQRAKSAQAYNPSIPINEPEADAGGEYDR